MRYDSDEFEKKLAVQIDPSANVRLDDEWDFPNKTSYFLKLFE